MMPGRRGNGTVNVEDYYPLLEKEEIVKIQIDGDSAVSAFIYQEEGIWIVQSNDTICAQGKTKKEAIESFKRTYWGQSVLDDRIKKVIEWHDAKNIPNNNRNVLVYYKCHGVEVQTTAHYDFDYKGWYDWCGDEIEEDIVAWRELPEKPTRPTGSIIKECDEKIPEKPKGYPLRIIQEGEVYICKKCGSSIKTKWFGFKKLGCIQPECEDYYGRK